MWDVFGKGVVQYLRSKVSNISIPQLMYNTEEFSNEDIQYLYQHFRINNLSFVKEDEEIIDE